MSNMINHLDRIKQTLDYENLSPEIKKFLEEKQVEIDELYKQILKLQEQISNNKIIVNVSIKKDIDIGFDI